MPRITGQTIKLEIDGKIIDIKKPSKRNFSLTKSLLDDIKFQEFVNDPKGYAAKYDFDIDHDISAKLKAKLDGTKSLEDLKKVLDDPWDPAGATVWAVAKGVYSVASSKIAVAF